VRDLLLVAGLMAAVVVYAIFDANSGIRTLWQVRTNVSAAEGRVASLAAENAVLEQEAAALESDPFAVESAIRTDLGLILPGERVVRPLSGDDSNPRFP